MILYADRAFLTINGRRIECEKVSMTSKSIFSTRKSRRPITIRVQMIRAPAKNPLARFYPQMTRPQWRRNAKKFFVDLSAQSFSREVRRGIKLDAKGRYLMERKIRRVSRYLLWNGYLAA